MVSLTTPQVPTRGDSASVTIAVVAGTVADRGSAARSRSIDAGSPMLHLFRRPAMALFDHHGSPSIGTISVYLTQHVVAFPCVCAPYTAWHGQAAVRRLIPLADRVLVKRMLPQTKSAGGILLPETGTKKLNEGEVVAVGPGAMTREGTRLPIDIAVGAKVMLPEYGGHNIELDGAPDEEELVLYRADDILGVFEG